MMRRSSIFLGAVLLASGWARAQELSEATQTCLSCHVSVLPGIHGDWLKSKHSRTRPSEAMGKGELERRFSANSIPEELAHVVVGCAECHTLNPESHPDTFEHNGFKVHTLVSPRDCSVCHPVEASQFEQNLMSRAHGNLMGNPLYAALANSINGPQAVKDGALLQREPEELTQSDSCLACHGTKVQVGPRMTRETSIGSMEFPALRGWPNQGVGRINPDGTRGSCAACHTRHAFSIEVARKPETCSQCHKGPDVPAYAVYQVSKHGNLYNSTGNSWKWDEVPWRVGKDFQAPTCATCHVSLIVDPDGNPLTPRSHAMADRLPWRLFGLIYSHPHPRSPDTTGFRNSAGLALPTELTGEPVETAVIGPEELEKRLSAMEGVCSSCHSSPWVQGHFEKLKKTISDTNASTLEATRLVLRAWEKGLAKRENPFDEGIERMWVEQWLFFSNSTRFASAMAGADYGVFAHGRWDLTKNLRKMWEWLEEREGK